MNNDKKSLALFYLEKERAFYYSLNTPHGIALELPKEVVENLELLSDDKLYEAIKAFIQQNKLTASNLVILIGNPYLFEKEIDDKPTATLDLEVQEYLEYIPFEYVASKMVKIDNKWKISAVNKELCEALKSSFEKQKFNVLAVVPLSLVQLTIKELAGKIDLRILQNHLDALKGLSLLTTRLEIQTSASNTSFYQKNKQTVVLIIVFVVLLLILLLVIIFSRGQK